MKWFSAKTWSAFLALLGYAVLSALVVATLLELTSYMAWSAYRRFRPTFPELRAASPVYAGQPWAKEFLQEETARQNSHKVYAPFRLWTAVGWHAQYLNNDEGYGGAWRRTINPATNVCATTRSQVLWVFGGSTVYGTGVPDFATLPSYLSRDLNADHRSCVVVQNFGVEGYVSNQELILLLEQLKAGQSPDMVVFYDGVNDASAAGPSPGPPSPHYYYALIKNEVEGSSAARVDFIRESYASRLVKTIAAVVHPPRAVALSSAQLQSKADAILDNYEGNLHIAKSLSQAFHFRLYWFWQPSLYYGHKPMVPFEKSALESEQEKNWPIVINHVYEEAGRRAVASGDFVFLGNLFDSVTQPIYIDQGHLGPLGNELAAAAVANYIQQHPDGSGKIDGLR